MRATYRTYDVTYEHTTANSDTIRQNRATVTVLGCGEFKLKAEVERLRPQHRCVVILNACARDRSTD